MRIVGYVWLLMGMHVRVWLPLLMDFLVALASLGLASFAVLGPAVVNWSRFLAFCFAYSPAIT